MKDAHGLRGDLYIQLFAKSADYLESLEEVFLEIGERSGSFEVLRAKPFKDGLIVSVEGLPDRTAAEAWRKAQVSIDADLLISEPGDRLYLGELMDFVVFDGDVRVGIVRGFSSNGAQDLLQVELESGVEALVPLVDAFLVEIKMEEREIRMTLPPGLIE